MVAARFARCVGVRYCNGLWSHCSNFYWCCRSSGARHGQGGVPRLPRPSARVESRVRLALIENEHRRRRCRCKRLPNPVTEGDPGFPAGTSHSDVRAQHVSFSCYRYFTRTMRYRWAEPFDLLHGHRECHCSSHILLFWCLSHPRVEVHIPQYPLPAALEGVAAQICAREAEVNVARTPPKHRNRLIIIERQQRLPDDTGDIWIRMLRMMNRHLRSFPLWSIGMKKLA